MVRFKHLILAGLGMGRGLDPGADAGPGPERGQGGAGRAIPGGYRPAGQAAGGTSAGGSDDVLESEEQVQAFEYSPQHITI